jgi:hypothetical protein
MEMMAGRIGISLLVVQLLNKAAYRHVGYRRQQGIHWQAKWR